MEIFPLDDRILVEPIEEEEKVGTLLIPDTAKEKPMTGIVRAIGNDYDIVAGRPFLHELVKTGDRVLFGKHNGQEFRTGGKRFLVITRCDLLAVMR